MNPVEQAEEKPVDDSVNTSTKNDIQINNSQRKYENRRLHFKKPCWFFLNDFCKYGAYCKFDHPQRSNAKFRFENQKHKHSRNYGSVHDFPHSRFADRVTHDGNLQDRKASDTNRESFSRKNQKPTYTGSRVFTNSNRYSRPKLSFSEVEVSKHEERKSVSNEPAESKIVSNKPEESKSVSNEPEDIKPTESTSRLNTRLPLQLSLLSETDLQFLMQTEITQLQKRYPNLKTEHKDNSTLFTFPFSSSDPDWSFDLRSVELQVILPTGYPREICEVTVLNDDECMPSLLQRFLNRSMREWIEARQQSLSAAGKTEILLRPFFRWLDKNLEQLFIEGLRKVKRDVEARNLGIEFVPFETLPGAFSSSVDTVEERKYDSAGDDISRLAEDLVELKCNEADTADKGGNVTNPSPSAALKKSETSTKKGTEVKLLNFELRESAASILCQKIAVSVRCTRCKTYSDITNLSKQKHYANSCNKCHQIQSAVFHPVLMHAFSGILGYLHLNGCQAVDLPLVQCDFTVDCLNCNRQNTVNGINYGQTSSTWCLFCNHKLSFSAQAAKFQQLQPVERNGKLEASVSEANKRKIREPLIEVGKPLPNEGSCKHYKKSHRWLRFPCCGKAYPCDLCHDEKETDHEMKFASRMICGFCSKEQPYSKDKPCELCSVVLTKKSGSHWEGGKGCRDKVRMSREDKHKYAGTGKTISRKAVAFLPKKKK